MPFRIAWANLLRNHLEKISDNLISLYDLGVDGDTTRNLLKRLDVEATARKPELIIFAVGVNDSLYRKSINNPEVPIDEFEKNMKELIQKARIYTNKIIIVGLVKGDDNVTKPLIQSSTGKYYDKVRVGEYDRVLKKIADQENIVFVDIFKKLSDYEFDDGIHPNVNGHLKVFETVREELDKILSIKSEVFYTLVDRLDNIVGIKKKDSLEKRDIVRVSALWITNSNNEMLLSRRPYEKRRDPNRWGPAVACILEKDQTYLSAVKFATKNEIGLTNFEPTEDTKLFIDGEHTFYCQLFSIIQDLEIEKITINTDEVQELRWFRQDEVIKMIKEQPHLFVQSFNKYFSLYSN